MSAMTTLRRDVLSILEVMGPLSSSQISLAVGRDVSRISATLSLMVNLGWLRCEGVAIRQGRGMKPRILAITEAGVTELHRPRSPAKRPAAGSPRQDAMDAGLRKYMGKPCPHGHSGLRYVSNATCIQCASANSEAQNARRAAA